MSLSNYQQPVRSNPTVDFTEALVTNAGSANVDLTLPTRDALWFVRAIAIIATENLAYELQLFDSAENMGATIPEDHFVAVWQFGVLSAAVPASPGYPFDVPDVTPQNGFYHFYVDGNGIPYYDLDQLKAKNQGSGGTYPNNAKLHCRLINRSAATKTAGSGGALQVTFFLANQGQQP